MSGRKRPVVSVDEQGNVFGYYESSTEAAKCLGMQVANFHRAVRKGMLCKGKKWMYEADYREYWMQGRTHELAYTEHEIRSQRAIRAWRRVTPEERRERGRLISKAHHASPKVKKMDTSAAVAANSMAVMCINTGERFPSIAQCARSLRLSPAGVQRALKEGKRIKGYVITHETNGICK